MTWVAFSCSINPTYTPNPNKWSLKRFYILNKFSSQVCDCVSSHDQSCFHLLPLHSFSSLEYNIVASGHPSWNILGRYCNIVALTEACSIYHFQMPLITHVIQCKIQVRPGYFIRWVRSGWPVKKVTRMTQMTWPGCNADWSFLTCVVGFLLSFVTKFSKDGNNI